MFTNTSLDPWSGLPIWWEWVGRVGGEERKWGGGKEYGLDCLYSGDGERG